MEYLKIEQFDPIAKTITIENGSVFGISDEDQLKKLGEGIYRYVSRDSIGRLCCVDRPDAPTSFSSIEKRDGRTFSQVHSRLKPHFVGPAQIKTLAKADAPGMDDESQRLTKAVSAIHMAGTARRQRNTKIKRALAKAAQSDYSTGVEAQAAIKKALIAEGFDRETLIQWGF